MYNDHQSYTGQSNYPSWVNAYPQKYMDYPSPTFFSGQANINGRNMDIMVICARKYEFDFTEQDRINGYFNLIDKLPTLLTGVKDQIAIVTFQNGINTTREEWISMGKYLASTLPQGTLIIGLYNPTQGLPKDFGRTFSEKNGVYSKTVKNLAALHTSLLDIIEQHCPGAKILHIPHSEAGVIYNRSFESMPEKYQRKMEKHVYVTGVGPAESIPKAYGINAWNYYSNQDAITGWFASKDGDRYNVEWVDAITPMSKRTMGFADHTIKGDTYHSVIQNRIVKKVTNELGGFYVGKSR
ncbi:MAG: hypothetical protein SP4CHLAM5_10520 [Chlamydiia bacterium]|nr:hypothetical protein [Chlamydiia bacterium]MCH9624622.1 hypothetical protein [Chlamydiia bacterium]